MDGNELAAYIASRVRDTYGFESNQDGRFVGLPGGLTVVVDEPAAADHPLVTEVAIGVNHPAWGNEVAWDSGAALNGERSAADDWLVHVLPVFLAYALPGHEVASRVRTELHTDGRRSARVYHGPVWLRDFGGLTREFADAAAAASPTTMVARELLDGYAMPEKPLWYFTYSARLPNRTVDQVCLHEKDVSGGFPAVTAHLPWREGCSVKAWALIAPVPAAQSVTVSI